MSLLALLAAGGAGVPTPSLDLCSGGVCQAGGNPGCATLSGCTDTGEQHRVSWTHTNCNDTYHHVAIHRSVGGGSYVEIIDNLSCDRPEDDDGCCENFVKGVTWDGEYQYQRAFSSDLGSCTTTYQFKVRIEEDGTDTAEDECGPTTSATGCDTTCVA
jgi:hypothetical protein